MKDGETNKPSLAQQTLNNSFYSVVAYIWPILFSIVITPIVVLRLGVVQYGLFVFITTVSGLLGLVAGGVTSSTIRHITHYRAQGDSAKVRTLSRTTHFMFLAIGFIGAASIVGGFALTSHSSFSSYSFTHRQLLTFFSLAALNFFIQTSLNLYQLVPVTLQRFDVSSLLSMLNLTLLSIGNLVLVLLGFGIESLLVWQIVLGLGISLAFKTISEGLLPESRYALGFDKAEFLQCVKFGSMSTLNDLARTSLISLDRLLIPFFVGVSQLTYYSLPGNVASRIPGTADTLSGIIFPTATSLHSGGHMERLRILYVRSSRLIMNVSFAIAVTIILNASYILRYWLNASFSQNSTYVLIILSVTNLILSLLSPLASFFMGMNKLKFNTALSFFMAALNIVALAVLLPRFGITGAAYAYLLSVLPIFYAIYVIEHDYLDLKGRARYYAMLVLKHASVSAIMLAATVYVIHPLVTNLFTLAVLGPLAVVAYILVYWVLGFFEKEDVNDLKIFVGRFAKKLGSFAKAKA